MKDVIKLTNEEFGVKIIMYKKDGSLCVKVWKDDKEDCQESDFPYDKDYLCYHIPMSEILYMQNYVEPDRYQ